MVSSIINDPVTLVGGVVLKTQLSIVFAERAFLQLVK